MTRKRFSALDRVRIFDANDGRCHICNGKIAAGEAWEVEHVIPWELTRDDSETNVRPAHVRCHKVKTADDTRAIRKADRVRAKHVGAWPKSPRPMKGRGFQKR